MARRLTRFTTEARAASALQHPNVAAVYELGEHERQPFIAMEYVDGVTLEARLRDGPLPLDDALDVAMQIAAAHSRPRTRRASCIATSSRPTSC